MVAAVAAIHAIKDAEVPTTFVRISDANETAFSLSTQKKATSPKKKLARLAQSGLWALMRRRGWDTDAMCISYVCFEGSKADVAERRRRVVKIAKEHGALVPVPGRARCTTRRSSTPLPARFPARQDAG